jgi:hypothetical protein
VIAAPAAFARDGRTLATGSDREGAPDVEYRDACAAG